MRTDLHVIQVISDGPFGFPYDEVVQIGICAVDFSSGDVRSVLFETVKCDIDESKAEYLAENTSLSSSDISSGAPLNEVYRRVKEVLKGSSITSYDISNVLMKYLLNEPWDLTGETSVMPSVSSRLPASFKSRDPASENTKIAEAYFSLLEDDPADIGPGRTALDLALMTSYLVLALREDGKY